MAETGGNTSIKRVDVENLIKEGKIYATKADAEVGKTANVNSQYFDENNWEFDSNGRIIEIQKDGSKVVMGWANKDDLVSPKQTSSDRLSNYDNEGSYPATSDIGSQKTNTNTGSANTSGTDKIQGIQSQLDEMHNPYKNQDPAEKITSKSYMTTDDGTVLQNQRTNEGTIKRTDWAQEYASNPNRDSSHDAMQVVGYGDYVSNKKHLSQPTYDTTPKSQNGEAMTVISKPGDAMQVVNNTNTSTNNKQKTTTAGTQQKNEYNAKTGTTTGNTTSKSNTPSGNSVPKNQSTVSDNKTTQPTQQTQQPTHKDQSSSNPQGRPQPRIDSNGNVLDPNGNVIGKKEDFGL